MASIRNLKKDIDFLINEVVSDAQMYLFWHPNTKMEEATALIEEAVEIWNNLYTRVNHPNGKDNKKLVKEHYRSIHKDLLSSCNNLFEKLSSLSK